VHLVRAASLTGYLELAGSLRLDPYPLLHAAGLPHACLHDPDLKVSADAVRQLLEDSAKQAGEENFGLRLAEARQLSNLGPLALIVREGPTARKALEALVKYIRLHNEALNPRIDVDDGIVTIRPELRFERPVPARQAIELTIGVLSQTLRTFLGGAWKPRAVCFTHDAPRALSLHKKILGARVQFGSDFNGFLCNEEDLEHQLPHSDQLIARYARQYLDALLLNGPISMSDRVREMLWVRVPSGSFSLEAMAKQLGVAARTVERHLKREGTSFSAVLNQVRAEMVKQYVESTARPLYIVSELMGFSALSAFSRWFRDEFKCSPSSWRAARRRGGTTSHDYRSEPNL
jgi:AraC-like DNA-binding protein